MIPNQREREEKQRGGNRRGKKGRERCGGICRRKWGRRDRDKERDK